MEYIYKPSGVCSREFIFDIDDDTVKSLEVIGGCNGNGIAKLITGMKLEDIISRIEGVKCGFKNTSCPDQIACALKAYLNEKN